MTWEDQEMAFYVAKVEWIANMMGIRRIGMTTDAVDFAQDAMMDAALDRAKATEERMADDLRHLDAAMRAYDVHQRRYIAAAKDEIMAAEDYIGDVDDDRELGHDGELDPADEPGKPFDLRRHNGDVTIVNPKTGGRRCFRVEARSFKGDMKRVLMVLDGSNRENEHDWEAFAFVSSRGLHLWKRFIGEPHEKYLNLLDDPKGAQASGLTFYWRRAKETT